MPSQIATDRLRTLLVRPERFGPQPEVWIRFPRQLGDVVGTLPFLGGLKEHWNRAAQEAGTSLRWVAVGHKAWASVSSEAKPDIFAELVIEHGGSGKPDPWYLLRRWRKLPPIAVVNLSQSVRLCLAAFLAQVPIRAGIADNHLRLLYHYHFRYRKLPLHLADRYRPLLEQLTGTRDLACLRIGPENLGGERAVRLLEERGWHGEPFVTLCFGTVGNSKRWFPETEHWPALARQLLAEGYKVAWLGGPAEVALGAELAHLAPGSWDFTGKTTIPEAISLQSRAYGCIAIDTGWAHTSAAAGRPTVVFFGPTTENRYVPAGPKVVALRGCPVDLYDGQPLPREARWRALHRVPPERAIRVLHSLAEE